MNGQRRVVLLVFDGFQPLDLTGPMEVFATAERLRSGRYATEVVGASTRPVRSASGLAVTPDRTLEACTGPIDTLVVAGGTGVRAALDDERLVRWIASAAERSRRVVSVCTGAFLLAAAGLLDGRTATTHWASAELLADRHTEIAVEPDRIYVRSGDVWTSAGVTAGIDLALALVEDDHGQDVAVEVARWLVVFAQRPGGQSQFSAPLAARSAQRRPLREVQGRIRAEPRSPCSVEALAEQACMSPRNFARVLKRETGLTPAVWVETLRVEHARRLLELSALPTEVVAGQSGFGTVETMRRAFSRRLGVSPGRYRERFTRRAREAA